MLGKRKRSRIEEYVPVAERLRPYVDVAEADADPEAPDSPVFSLVDELMEKAVLLLTVMPRNQRRETIVELISPYDHERGRRAVDALVEAALVTEDDEGRLRRIR